ncbi:MAG TPA: pyridoxal phosphate-dependent aminotransferase [Candidatus Dormibacteraeota bacterium]|nr:pyridoxal phosphate-dependent aminotransferase [Candidatus Dormibacteraeota bacterium]
MFAKRTNWNLAPNALAEALAKHRAAGKPLIDLTVSNPTECGFTYESEVILDALRNAAALLYEPNARGLQVAREAVVRYYADRGDRVAVDDIILTTSTSEAYSWVFRLLCDAGDEVLVPAPSYPLLGFLADIQDVNLVRYPLFYDHGWHIDMHELERAITLRTRAVVVVHPNNPTGNYCRNNEMQRLGQICAERGLATIADEVFLDFALDGVRRASFVGSTEALTFTMSGISKICGLPQMKVAWLVASGPAALKSEALARLEVIADTYLSMNAPVQLALGALLGTRHGFQAQLLQRVRANLAELDRQLAAGALGERLEVEGGWYAVVLVPNGGGGQDFESERLAADGVLVYPGHFYDFAGERHVVISLLVCKADFTQGIKALLLP